MKQLTFFMNPSRLSWKIISQLLDQIFNANHLSFTGYGISTLEPVSPYSLPNTAPNLSYSNWPSVHQEKVHPGIE